MVLSMVNRHDDCVAPMCASPSNCAAEVCKSALLRPRMKVGKVPLGMLCGPDFAR